LFGVGSNDLAELTWLLARPSIYLSSHFFWLTLDFGSWSTPIY